MSSRDDADKFLIAHFEGTTDINPTLVAVLQHREQQTAKTRKWESKKPGDAIPVTILAELATDGHGRVGATYTEGISAAIVNGQLTSAFQTLMTFQYGNGDGVTRHQEFHVEAVQSYKGATVYEVVASDVYP